MENKTSINENPQHDVIETSRPQKLCSYCSTQLRDEDYKNSNDFYLSCSQHKRLAKIETKMFFQKNPVYTKWAEKK